MRWIRFAADAAGPVTLGDGLPAGSTEIRELDVVALTKCLPDHRLEPGDIGTVVMVHGDGRGFEVEFATLGRETLAVVTLPAGAVRPLRHTEIASARDVA